MKPYLGTITPLSEEQEEYRQKLRSVFIEGKAWCIVVSGSYGNGKTYIAKAALNCVTEYGAHYTTQPIVQAKLRNGEKDYYTYLCEVSNLVIDEMSDRPTDWTEFVKTNIENILIERHAHNRRTAIIGNIDAERFAAMFDARVRDRLKEGVSMIMNGESLRRAYEDERS
jgi:DNA replication protein DnaC